MGFLVFLKKQIYILFGSEKSDRKFPRKTEKECWEKCMMVLGRDPSRWRYDAAGNPVIKDCRGKHGPVGWEYDHIDPVANGGLSTLVNCQVLQTKANRRKSARKGVTTDELKDYSLDIKLKEEQMDFLELGIFGDLRDEMGRVKCHLISKDHAQDQFAIRKNYPVCPVPEWCSKEADCCKDAQMLLKMMSALRCKSQMWSANQFSPSAPKE